MCRYLSRIMKSHKAKYGKAHQADTGKLTYLCIVSPPSHAPAATTQEIRKRDRGRAKGSRVRGVLCTIKQT